MIYGISKKFNLLKILTKDILDEAYLKLELDKQTIENSLQQVVNNCIGKDDESILNELNKEFKSSKIEFHKNENKNIPISKCERSGIVYFCADLKVYVYVNTLFFNIIRNNNNSQISDLAIDLFINYTHEITHVEQNAKQKKIQPGIDISDATKDDKNYFSHTREIDAHAREVANYLITKNYSDSHIKYLLSTKAGVRQLSLENPTFYRYRYHFGPEMPKITDDTKIFNLFKKRICDFLNLDM